MTDTAVAAESTGIAAAQRPENACARLPEYRLYRVSGKDPHKFLHGQLSQSLDEISDSHSARAAACTPKGRTYALTLLAGDGDDVLLRLPESVADHISQQLNKFLMLFRGTRMDRLEDATVFGLWGQDSALALSSDAASLASPGDSLSLDDGKLIRVEDTAEGTQRYEFWRLQGDRQPAVDLAGAADWAAADISAGVPELSPKTLEEYVPQMLNLQHIGGIHFKKGCYTGQEVVARMHYLGQLKKSVFRLAVDGTEAIDVGTPVLAGDSRVGEVVNSVRFDDGHQEVLAVIKHTALAKEPWQVEGHAGQVSRLPLSYAVPEQDAS
ncbi:YgfZ/GcvT domain-containing protein [Marinobacter sp. JSM 1782161]|uniref:CAF17-like 4Fe-4S cluster assembly/insertion protein YgfZ n=1 Tax=Marinobacter sp. JSM 1782161 TaxID=2685906 RepID=UPI001402B394|nr:folate-binding protein YgfZ [Marinobacter sp. JSM 1782161]